MNEQSNCIFCKIIAGELSSTKIYEDNDTLAFLTIQPEQPGHTLVIPKKHIRNIIDCPKDTLDKVFETVQKLTADFIDKGAKAVQVLQNNEKPLQEVFHFHVHVIPYK